MTPKEEARTTTTKINWQTTSKLKMLMLQTMLSRRERNTQKGDSISLQITTVTYINIWDLPSVIPGGI